MTKRANTPTPRFRPAAEPLEPRDVPAGSAVLSGGVLTVTGTADADALGVNRRGQSIIVGNGSELLGTFDARQVKTVVVDAAGGDDVVYVAPNVRANAVVLAGDGNDLVTGGTEGSILVGGAGSDVLYGGSDSDILVGGSVALSADDLVSDVLAVWTGDQTYAQRVAALRPVLAPAVADDGTADFLLGFGSRDWYFAPAGDVTDAKKKGDVVN